MVGLSGMFSKIRDQNKLSSVVGCLEKRDGIQRGWNRLGQWNIVSLMKLNVAKCKLLHLVWSNAKHDHGLDNYGVGSSPEEKNLGRGWIEN